MNSHPAGSASGWRAWLGAAALSCACGLAIIAPFFWLGTASGHDIQFHASSWLDAAEQWKQGVWFPRWAAWANYGFGEPRFIFYPPLSWMLGAALGSLTSWKTAVGLYVVVVQTLAGSSAYALLRKTVAHRGALFGAACFAANPYALLVVYMRSDYAELLAMAFFPVVLLVALQLCGMLDIDGGSKRRVIVFFAASYAAVWLSNAPAGVIGSYSVAMLFVWAAVASRSWRPLVNGAVGIVLGLGLAGFYLVPAAYEQKWVNIGQALSAGLQPAENFLYAKTGDAEHDAFNWIASGIAVLLLAGVVVAAGVAIRRQQDEQPGERRIAAALLVVAGAAALLMLRPTLILWELLPKLKFVQFPWRWMSMVAVAFAWFLAAAAAKKKRWSWIWMTGAIAVLCSTGVFLVKKAWWDWNDIPTLQAGIEEGKGFEGTDEYDPLGDDHTNIPQRAPRAEVISERGLRVAAPHGEIEIVKWAPEEKVVRVRAKDPLRVALRLLNYPAWRVEVNGKAATPQSAETNGQMVLLLSPGTQRITARFARTLDRTLGIAISLLGVLTLLALLNAGGLHRARRRFLPNWPWRWG